MTDITMTSVQELIYKYRGMYNIFVNAIAANLNDVDDQTGKESAISELKKMRQPDFDDILSSIFFILANYPDELDEMLREDAWSDAVKVYFENTDILEPSRTILYDHYAEEAAYKGFACKMIDAVDDEKFEEYVMRDMRVWRPSGDQYMTIRGNVKDGLKNYRMFED